MWAYDFVHDVCKDGRKLKVLTVQHQFSRRALAVNVCHRMTAAGAAGFAAAGVRAGRGGAGRELRYRWHLRVPEIHL